MDKNKINEALSKLDDISYCLDTENCFRECQMKCFHQEGKECPLDDYFIDYCNNIKATTRLASKLGINFFRIQIGLMETEVRFMIKGTEELKMRKLRIAHKGDDIEAYARVALLLECCVLEGLCDGIT